MALVSSSIRLGIIQHRAKVVPVWTAVCCPASSQRATMTSSTSTMLSSPLQNSSEDSSHKAVAMFSHLKSLARAPLPAIAYGFAGLIPFAAGPITMIDTGYYDPMLVQHQIAYGALILSFVGGVRWGKIAIPTSPIEPSWGQFTISIVPSIIGLSALTAPTLPLSSLILGTGLGAACYSDIFQDGYESWFKGLRITLTSVALFSLGLALLFNLTLPEIDDETRRRFSKSYGRHEEPEKVMIV